MDVAAERYPEKDTRRRRRNIKQVMAVRGITPRGPVLSNAGYAAHWLTAEEAAACLEVLPPGRSKA